MPATGAVMEASIFIASMVATVAPASTVSPSAATIVTTPSNGAATCPGLDVSAFSTVGASAATDLSRTLTGRSWPLIVHITDRMPRSSASLTACSPKISRLPSESSTWCSSPVVRP